MSNALDLKEMREVYDDYGAKWDDIRDQGDLDMQALSVDGPWPKEEKEARTSKDYPRPMVHQDIIGQTNNRTVNQILLNKRGIQVMPTGDGSNDEKARRREDRMRQIQYESRAHLARQTAFQNAVDRGYGYYRVRTDFISPRSMNQKIVIDRIPNPNSALIDPYTKEADRRDMERAFLIERMSRRRFEKEWPKAAVKSFSDDLGRQAGIWHERDSVQLAEYFVRDRVTTDLFVMQGLGPFFKDELDKQFPGWGIQENLLFLDKGIPGVPFQSRKTEYFSVKRYMTNGVEQLAVYDWLGSTIPIIVVTGREKYEADGKMVLESLTRKQRAAQFSFDLVCSQEEEVLGMSPNVVYMMYEGQERTATPWNKINKTPLGFALVKPEVDAATGQVLPLPRREAYDPPIVAFEAAKNAYQRAAMNAAGMFSVETKDRVAKSGIAQEKMDQAADVGAYHFTDSLNMAIEYEGWIVNELLEKIEDSERRVGLRKADDSFEAYDLRPMQTPDGKIDHPYGDADGYSLTLSVGPNDNSQREKASEFADTLSQIPGVMALLGPLIVQLKNLGPIGDKMVDVLKAALPPNIKAAYDEDGKDQPQIPPEVIAMLEQQKQLVEALQQKLQEAESGLTAKQLEIQGRVQIEQARIQAELRLKELDTMLEQRKLEIDLQLQQMKNAVAVRVQDMKDATVLTKTGMEIDSKETLAAATLQHTSNEAERDRAHTGDNAQ